jgi:hypothetical protein
MKSYTNLEQSKILSKILPLESADMTYRPIMDIDSMSNSGFLNTPECYPFNEFKNSTIKPLPCWSLAALLDVIPEVSLNTFKDGKWNAMVQHDDKMIYEDKDNPVDACYEMILKLHELKML